MTLQATNHLGWLTRNHRKLEEARKASPRPPRPWGVGEGPCGRPDCRLPASGNGGQYSPVVWSLPLMPHILTERFLWAVTLCWVPGTHLEARRPGSGLLRAPSVGRGWNQRQGRGGLASPGRAEPRGL